MNDFDAIAPELRALTDEYRSQCLWWMPPDYYPESREAALRVLERIQRFGDVEAFKRAGKMKEWLLRSSSATSAD